MAAEPPAHAASWQRRRAAVGVGVLAALAAAGCGGTALPGTAAAALPSWAHRLGPSVTVLAPAPAVSGQGSPAAAVTGMVDALDAGKPAQACGYFLPSAQPQCRQALSAVPADGLPTVKGLAIGYVALDASRALVGTTGTYCTPGGGPAPACFTNTDPAKLFASARSFDALWQATIAAQNLRPAYSLAPCTRSGGRWYDDALPGSGGV